MELLRTYHGMKINQRRSNHPMLPNQYSWNYSVGKIRLSGKTTLLLNLLLRPDWLDYNKLA